MVKVEDAVVARWETQGSRFEVLVDPQAVQDLKDGKPVDLRDKLALDQVFKDAKKGDKISEEHLERTFHTRDLAAIARQIIEKGEVQVTTEQRHRLQEAKRKQIVAAIARNAMNPQTGSPHPAGRIDAAMTEAKVHIDPFRPADQQVQEVLQKLRPLLPIRFDVVRVRIRLPGQHY
ncbi:MAG TPA: ribosome assembly factor SBDS, partial [Thermoplasmata archaeon]|nr:ribosome assembly factor SBDS [Thermoplasmata archaeon]